jgi:hypothetical protein
MKSLQKFALFPRILNWNMALAIPGLSTTKYIDAV